MTSSAEPVWLTRRLIDAIHDRLLAQHGGSPGVRDEGMIASALARPQNRWAYHPDTELSALAASLGFGFAKNHGYVDGNKRVAFMAMYVFLGLNGWELDVGEPEAVVVMNAVAASDVSEPELGAWLAANLVPLASEPPSPAP